MSANADSRQSRILRLAKRASRSLGVNCSRSVDRRTIRHDHGPLGPLLPNAAGRNGSIRLP
jgi:hypothetical protein